MVTNKKELSAIPAGKRKTKEIAADKIVTFRVSIPADTPDEIAIDIAKAAFLKEHLPWAFSFIDGFNLKTAAGVGSAKEESDGSRFKNNRV